MKKQILFLIVTLFIGWLNTQAQERTTKEAKVILVVNQSTSAVTSIVLFKEIKVTHSEKELNKKFPNSKFYLGLLQGSYKIIDKKLIPSSGATIIIYTDKQLLQNEQLFSSDKLSQGDQFKLGKVNSKVISSKRGELILKTM